MVVKWLITILCGVGLYASLFMLRKARRADRGELREPSVVETPRAKLFAGVQNSLLGAIYYPALIFVTWLVSGRAIEYAIFLVVLFAGATSAALAYSLLFVTRRPCPYCWLSHAINWLLIALYAAKIWGAQALR